MLPLVEITGSQQSWQRPVLLSSAGGARWRKLCRSEGPAEVTLSCRLSAHPESRLDHGVLLVRGRFLRKAWARQHRFRSIEWQQQPSAQPSPASA